MAKLFSKIKDALIEQENPQETFDVSEYADLLKQANINKTAPVSYVEDNIEISSDVLNPSDIYDNNNMATDIITKNIFKVAELRDALPSNLPTESKKQTVINMMPISGLNIEEVLNDAEIRQSLLTQALESNNAMCKDAIMAAKDQISQREAQIEALKIDIQNKEKLIEDNNKVIGEEIAKIESIKQFIL